MAKADILQEMRRRNEAMGFAIERMRQNMTATTKDTVKIDMAGRLSGLIERRNELTSRLNGWEELSDERWSNLRTQIEIEWGTLALDLEERMGRLE